MIIFSSMVRWFRSNELADHARGYEWAAGELLRGKSLIDVETSAQADAAGVGARQAMRDWVARVHVMPASNVVRLPARDAFAEWYQPPKARP